MHNENEDCFFSVLCVQVLGGIKKSLTGRRKDLRLDCDYLLAEDCSPDSLLVSPVTHWSQALFCYYDSHSRAGCALCCEVVVVAVNCVAPVLKFLALHLGAVAA